MARECISTRRLDPGAGVLHLSALFAALFAAILFSSDPSLARAPATSPLIGAWTVEVSRLPMPPAARPRQVMLRFTDSGAGQWTVEVEITAADGRDRKSTLTATADGSKSPVKGDTLEADTAALQMPRPDVMVLVLSRQGLPGSTRIYTVAADGKSMVETATYFDKDGAPVLRTNYFARAE